MAPGGAPATTDVIVGVILTLAVLEGTRRAIGLTLPILSIVFILYTKFGNFFPEPFTHRGHDLERIISNLYLSTDGIFGIPLGVSSTMVAIFIIFAALLQGTGGERFSLTWRFPYSGWSEAGRQKLPWWRADSLVPFQAAQWRTWSAPVRSPSRL